MDNKWCRWFAWHPVIIDGKWIWLRGIERKLEIDYVHSSQVAHYVDTHYRIGNP